MQKEIFTLIGNWWERMGMGDIPLIAGQNTPSPSPSGTYGRLIIIESQPYATNSHKNNDDTTIITQSLKITLQLSFFGEDAFDTANLFSMLWCDDIAVSFFRENNASFTPLSAKEVRYNISSDIISQDVPYYSLEILLDAHNSTFQKSQSAKALHADIIEVNTQPE